MRRFLVAVPLLAACVSPSVAGARKPVIYEGLTQQILRTATGYAVSTIFLGLSNPNAGVVEIHNTRCEFYDGDKLVKQFSIPSLKVTPGTDKYEAPVKVEEAFNRPICRLGKQTL